MDKKVVHLIDDDPSMLTSICYFLESEGLDCRCYSSAQDFLKNFKEETPGCIVLDVKMPEVNGIELFDELLKREIRLPVIFFSGHGDLPMAVNVLRKGAFHFLEKPLRPEIFLDAVKEAVKEDERRRAGMLSKAQLQKQYEKLTEREKGLTNKIIAERKGLSERTIENYRANLYKKLNVRNMDELKTVLQVIEKKK